MTSIETVHDMYRFSKDRAPWREIATEEEQAGYTSYDQLWGQVELIGTNQATAPLDLREGDLYPSLKYVIRAKTWNVMKISCAVLDQLAVLAYQKREIDPFLREGILTFYVSNFRIGLSPCQRLFNAIIRRGVTKPCLWEETNLILELSPDMKIVNRLYARVMKTIFDGLHQASAEQNKQFDLEICREHEYVEDDRDHISRFDINIILRLRVPLRCLRNNTGEHPDDNIFLRAAEILDPEGEFVGAAIDT